MPGVADLSQGGARLRMRAAALALIALLALSGCLAPAAHTAPQTVTSTVTVTAAPPPVPPAAPPPQRIGHVFILVLENEGYNSTFASPPPSPYLATALPAMGRLLTNYYGIGHNSLDNYVAMVSGQGPNALTQGDCPVYADFVSPATDADGQALGQGCVYPPAIQTIGSQLAAAGHTWRQYAEGMASIPASAPTACRHQPINSQDTWQGSTDPKDQYATRHVPFVYFHSVIDDQKSCAAHVVDLNRLPGDLANGSAAPEYIFITPDVCSDGHDATCANPNRPGGYKGIEAFLRAWVPRILNSTAYKQDGLLVVNFDEASTADTGACCGEPTGPDSPKPGISGPGGGRVGAILLSPCLEPGSVDKTPYNHFSLLRTAEDLFHVPHLGYAGKAGLAPFDLGRCTPKPS
jgi:hypothetical protein